MTKLPIPCPNCHKTLKVSPEILGRKVRCPGCQETFRLPAEEPTRTLELPTQPNEEKPNKQQPTAATDRSPAPAVRENAESPSPADAAEAAPMPMAKLIPKGPAAKSADNEPLALPTGLDTAEITTPKVKFKRKRSNPWPTIILAVVALSILGVAVTVIAIMQGNGSTSTASNLPELLYVNDANVSLGQTAIIPVKVQFPPQMTIEQTQQWEIQLTDNAPDGATYDPESESIRWTPTFRQAGTAQSIEAKIVDKVSGQSNVARFQVVIAPISTGERELRIWKETVEREGATVSISKEMTTEGVPAKYRDVDVNGVAIRVYLYDNPESAQQNQGSIDPAGDLATKWAGEIPQPLVVKAVGSLLLFGNQDSVKGMSSAASLFQLETDQLPTDPTMANDPDTSAADADQEEMNDGGMN